MTECKPEDAICIVETDLTTDFDEPLDYKHVVKKQDNLPLAKTKSTIESEKEGKYRQEAEKILAGAARIDGKKPTAAQVNEVIKQLKQKDEEDLVDFDPRKHRLPHGIRGYVDPANPKQSKFAEAGTRIN